MTSSHSTTPAARFAFATLLATIVFGAASSACGVFGSDDPASPPADDAQMPAREDPKAMAVGGTPDPSELTDQFGVFVSPNGQPHTDGNHVRPASSIQDGIDLAKRVGKRVYVCAGTFHEQITLADSISIIGGLDCTNNEWNVGKPGARTRIEAPKSPAVTATNITSPTRLEGLDIIAPDASTPSGSSIALIADHAGALTIATSKLTAGNAAKGDDGKDAIQLADAPTANGNAGWDELNCTTGASCKHGGVRGWWLPPPRGQQGENVCVGAPGFVAQSGGFGGMGGLYIVYLNQGIAATRVYVDNGSYNPELGDHTRTSAPGTDGADGSGAQATIAISAAGYTPANGTAGKDGSPGSGGSGGDGYFSGLTNARVDDVWAGWAGAGGGAGGCPGLAGSEGKGGGASIAAVLVESPVKLDTVELVASRGGAGGLGSFGSAPTIGGAAGINTQPASIPARSAQPGGRGGAAGVSGNGANGPSLGIAYVGTKPSISADTKVTAGAPAAAIPPRSRTMLGVAKTIPATPAGIAKDILGL